MSQFADPSEIAQVITCCDCGTEFNFTVGERDFYESKNMTPPKRCKPCREKKKAKFNEGNSGKNQGRDRY